MSLITCQNAAFSYEGVTVLSGIDFMVQRGEYLCIVGENGAGKSTLLKGLLGLKKPSEGSIIMGEECKRREIGYLPQQTAAQKDFPASVMEVVLSGRLNNLGNRIFYRKKDRADAEDKMEQLEILNLKNRCYRDLSGGQQQRVLLARALCATERLLLLDEPVAGLDPVMTVEMYRVIQKLHKERNITVIMVSHDIRGVMEQADHVLQLGSRQLFYGTIQEYLQSDIGRRFTEGSGC